LRSTGDVKATLQGLLPLLTRKNDRSFLQEAQRRMADWNQLLETVETTARSPLRPQMVIRALSDLLPDDAVRNLVRQGKTEQIYSVMQTNTSRGMQTMEQSLADLVVRRVISRETAFDVTSRRDEFDALLARSGVAPRSDEHLPEALRGLRVAGAAQ